VQPISPGGTKTPTASGVAIDLKEGENWKCTFSNKHDDRPALMLDKTGEPITYDAVGDVIAYSYKLTNTGNVTPVAPFTVTDDKATDGACPATPAQPGPR
jgi:hypothetical protein